MTWLRSSFIAVLVLGPACTSNSIDLEMTSADSSEDGTETNATSGGSASASASADATASATATDTTPQPTSTTSPGTVTTDPDTADTGLRLDIGDVGETQIMLLAISSVIDPSLPFQGIVWMERSGDSAVDLRLQWLSLDVGSTTEPRMLVGDVYEYPGVPVDPDGGFIWEAGVLLVPGAANPITGSDVVLSATLSAALEAEPYCGRVSGEVTSPIMVSIEGSTHAMTWVPDETELPFEFLMSCP